MAHIPLLGSQSRGCDFLPEVKSVLHFLTINRRGEAMPARTKMLRDGTIGREEPLGVTRRLEPLHASLALTGRLGGVLRPIVQIAMLAMCHPWQELALSSTIALQLIGNDNTRYVGSSLEQLAEELLRGLLVPATLHQDIQHVPVLIYGPPQIVMLALDRQTHFVHLPLVAGPRTAATQLVGIVLTTFATPLSLVRAVHRSAGEIGPVGSGVSGFSRPAPSC
jgi:hypothetical protein